MIITDFFTEEEKLELEMLVGIVYREVEDQTTNIFKLDTFPDLHGDLSFDAGQPTQALVWTAFDMDTDEVNGKDIVKAINPDTIVVQIVSLYVYLKEMKLTELGHIRYQAVFKEFIRSQIIYQLIMAHTIKYEYDRFIGEEVRPFNEIMKDVIEREHKLEFYKKLQNFYAEKFPENVIGKHFTDLNLLFIEFLQKTKTVKGMGNYPAIADIVKKIIEEVETLY